MTIEKRHVKQAEQAAQDCGAGTSGMWKEGYATALSDNDELLRRVIRYAALLNHDDNPFVNGNRFRFGEKAEVGDGPNALFTAEQWRYLSELSQGKQ